MLSSTKGPFKYYIIKEVGGWLGSENGIVRNHIKLLHVYKSRRGFSKGTVLCSGY